MTHVFHKTKFYFEEFSVTFEILSSSLSFSFSSQAYLETDKNEGRQWENKE